MKSFFHLQSFQIYNILLFILFCIIVNPNSSLYLLYYSLYVLFHFILIYLCIYHFKKVLYYIYFLYGLSLDILWFNEIGPHLICFMSILFFTNLFRKYLYNLNSLKTYILLICLLVLMIFIELLSSNILFDLKINFFFIMQISIISIFLSFPIFIFFSKIDKIK